MANEKYIMMAENPTGTGSFSLNRRANSTKGTYSLAEGYNNVASGFGSHAEGIDTVASGAYSHVEGNKTTASGQNAHAEGGSNVSAAAVTTSTVDTEIIAAWQNSRFALAKGQDSHVEGTDCLALGTWSHAEGTQTQARGARSHTEGSSTIASADSSHSGGHNTIAANYASAALGKFNANMTAGGAVANTTGTAFVIGNGTSTSARSNALSVQFNGVVKAKSTITASTTADYAEFFEWADGNPDGEDRVGYFVTLEGDKIKIATSEDDYILGVVSGEPFVLGNGDCDTWTNMHLRDEFRRTIYEPAPKLVEILDDNGLPTGEYEEVEGEFEGTRPKLNPEYDPTQEYISRFDRPEWSAVGMLGVLAVRHDGTAQVNGYVTVNDEGIATACEAFNGDCYRVIKSNSESVVEIVFTCGGAISDEYIAYIDPEEGSSEVENVDAVTSAKLVSYNNSNTDLTSTNVQGAVDEISNKIAPMTTGVDITGMDLDSLGELATTSFVGYGKINRISLNNRLVTDESSGFDCILENICIDDKIVQYLTVLNLTPALYHRTFLASDAMSEFAWLPTFCPAGVEHNTYDNFFVYTSAEAGTQFELPFDGDGIFSFTIMEKVSAAEQSDPSTGTACISYDYNLGEWVPTVSFNKSADSAITDVSITGTNLSITLSSNRYVTVHVVSCQCAHQLELTKIQ